jgi:hypothetical protein
MNKIYQQIASRLLAMENCRKTGNTEWLEKHEQTINKLVEDHMPSGSGFDNGTHLNYKDSTPNTLVFNTSYHHMDEGCYDGWTEHTVTVKPSLAFGFDLRISGRDRNGIKDYIHDAFHTALCEV